MLTDFIVSLLVVFKNDRDRTRHSYVHKIYYGHRNAFSCEICCVQYPRSDILNKHRLDTHGQEKMEKPYFVVEFCSSFTLVHSEGMSHICKRNVITITKFVGFTEDGRDIFNARYVNNVPKYSEEDGSNFEIVSERDTCCQCSLYFENTREFAFHMENYHEGQAALTRIDPQYLQFCIFETYMPRGGEEAGHNEASVVVPLPNAPGVIPGVVEEEAANETIVNDRSAVLLDNWDSDLEDESLCYYPPIQEVEGGSDGSDDESSFYYPLP